MTHTPPTMPRDPALYRPNVGLAVFNDSGGVLIAQRIGQPSGHMWQMPQGGMDPGEAPAEAAFRELEEEIGLPAAKVALLEELPEWLYYDFPAGLAPRNDLTQNYRGQRQKWFAFRLLGTDKDVRLDAHTPEFSAWRWAKLQDTPALIVPFKRGVYEEVARRFAAHAVPV